VSIVMPVKNAAPYIRQAMHSVLQHHQSPLELIVVDDGSVDGSGAIAASVGDARVSVVPGPQQGIAACLNFGWSQASGDIIMCCDADDLFPDDRIRRQLQWLSERPDLVAVCGAFDMIDAHGTTVARPFGEAPVAAWADMTEELLRGELRTSLCTFAIRRAALGADLGFRSYFETAEDIDFALRLAERGRVAFSPECCYHYRIHGSSITHSQPSARRVFFDDMARRFALQRRARGVDDLMRGCPPVHPFTAVRHTVRKSTCWH